MDDQGNLDKNLTPIRAGDNVCPNCSELYSRAVVFDIE
jgi:hypothetical protein